MTAYGLSLLSVLLAAATVKGFPVLQQRPKSSSTLFGSEFPSTELVGFLRRFGYFPSTGPQSAPIYDVESVKNAIRQMQLYGGLQPTGNLDNQTLGLLNRGRCGLPDVEDSPSQNESSASELQGQNERGRWQKRRITYSFENWLPNVDRRILEAEMEKAFGIWSAYSSLVFRKERKNSPGDISILFARGYHGDSYPFDGPGNILAHAFLPNGNGKSPMDGDIHFDADEEFFVTRRQNQGSNSKHDRGWYFLAVAAHEIGHSLGLSHSPDTDSIMFPYYQTGEPKLGYTDITNLYTKYVSRNMPDEDEEREQQDQDADTTATTRSSSISTTATTVTRPAIFTTTSTYNHDQNSSVSDAPGLPKICDVDFDTIAFLRNELFVFKDKFMWRLHDRGPPSTDYPALISRLFPALEGVPRIDAAFERDSDGRLLFFSGSKYWEFDGTKLAQQSPKSIENFGLPVTVVDGGVDAAFIWEKNGLTYCFSGDQFWRYNETAGQMDKNYPQPISKWGGVPNNLTAVMRWRDAKTYFFKEEVFWRFNDSSVDVEDGFPKRTKEYWFNCKR